MLHSKLYGAPKYIVLLPLVFVLLSVILLFTLEFTFNLPRPRAKIDFEFFAADGGGNDPRYYP